MIRPNKFRDMSAKVRHAATALKKLQFRTVFQQSQIARKQRHEVDEFEQWIEMDAAFDKRHDDPTKNYGIHGVDMRFYLRGPKGAVQFVLFTNWQLPHVTQELAVRHVAEIQAGGSGHVKPVDILRIHSNPLPADLGCHAYEPQYDDQERMESCDILLDAPGGCYYDGSGLAASEVYKRLLEEGSDGVWAALKDCYKRTFEHDEGYE